MNKVKIGDKVRRISDPYFTQVIGTEFVIKQLRPMGSYTEIQSSDNLKWYDLRNFELVDAHGEKRHVHHDLIVAWAKGALIQFRLKVEGEWKAWTDIKKPTWTSYYYETEYRIKPEPKPDYVSVRDVALIEGAACHTDEATYTSKVKYTFYGETGKLKSVEII